MSIFNRFASERRRSFHGSDIAPKIVSRKPQGRSLVQNDNDCINHIQIESVKIWRAYKKFSESPESNRDLSGFNEAVKALKKIKHLYSWRIQHRHHKDVEMFVKVQEAWSRIIQEMNAEMPCVTQQDVRNVATFVTPPCEGIYFDDQRRGAHCQPDHSKLLQFGSRYFSKKGISRNGAFTETEAEKPGDRSRTKL